MTHFSLPLELLLAIFLGSVIGLERESTFTQNKEKTEAGHLGGLRTYSLISLLGAVSGYLFILGHTSLFLTLMISFLILITVYYAMSGTLTKSVGLTTELGAIFSYLVGFFTTSEIFPLQFVVALTVVISLILSLKEKSRSFILGIKRTEINAFLGFAIIALVILPFLPNQSYYLTDIPAVKIMLGAYHVQSKFLQELEIINPFKLWFIVALITGIDITGYFLEKIIGGKQGLLLTSAVGGFISSTSTTQSLAQQSKKSQHLNQLVAAAIFANLTSFLQIFVLVAPLNSSWLVDITPTLLFIIGSALAIGIIINNLKKKGEQKENRPEEKTKEKPIFSLGPAVRFAVILILIRTITKTSLAFFGEKGFLLSSIIASFSGIDAIVINLSELAGKTITVKSALLTLICVNATNLLSKSVYSFFQAKKEFALKFLLAMLIVISSSFLGYFFF